MSKSRQLTLEVMGKWKGSVDSFWVLAGSGGVMASALLALGYLTSPGKSWEMCKGLIHDPW